eukprot:1748929-Lingulodinium_polyedra.AAC.1
MGNDARGHEGDSWKRGRGGVQAALLVRDGPLQAGGGEGAGDEDGQRRTDGRPFRGVQLRAQLQEASARLADGLGGDGPGLRPHVRGG